MGVTAGAAFRDCLSPDDKPDLDWRGSRWSVHRGGISVMSGRIAGDAVTSGQRLLLLEPLDCEVLTFLCCVKGRRLVIKMVSESVCVWHKSNSVRIELSAIRRAIQPGWCTDAYDIIANMNSPSPLSSISNPFSW